MTEGRTKASYRYIASPVMEEIGTCYKTTEGNTRPRVETACEYSCVRASSQAEYKRFRVGRLHPSTGRLLPRQFTN